MQNKPLQHQATLPVHKITRWCLRCSFRPSITKQKSIGLQTTRARATRHAHRRKADNIFARALICALGTFLGPSPSSSRGDPGMLRSEELLVAASRRWKSGDFCGAGGRSAIVPSWRSLGLRVRGCRTGGDPKISPTGSGYWPLGSWPSSQGIPFMTVKRVRERQVKKTGGTDS